MVVRPAVQNFRVQVGFGVGDEAGEEILDKLGLQIADQSYFYPILINQRGSAAEIDRGNGQRFIHRHHEIPGAQDAFLVAQGFVEKLAEDDACVFDRMMLVDIQIAFDVEGEIESRRVLRTAPACDPGIGCR